MNRLFLLFTIIFSVNQSFTQDSLEVMSCFNHSDFESRICGFSGNYKVRTAIISEKYIKMDNIETSDSLSITEILEFEEMNLISKMNQDEVKVVRTENTHNYYKCYSADTVPFFKVAMVSFPLERFNPDSMYTEIKKEIKNGIVWNKLWINNTCIDPSKMNEMRGNTGWVQFGSYVSDFENALIDLEVGETTMVRLPVYGLAYVILKTDEIQKSVVRKVKWISVED